MGIGWWLHKNLRAWSVGKMTLLGVARGPCLLGLDCSCWWHGPLTYRVGGVLACGTSLCRLTTRNYERCIVVFRPRIALYRNVSPLYHFVPINAEPTWFGIDLFTQIFYYKWSKEIFWWCHCCPCASVGHGSTHIMIQFAIMNTFIIITRCTSTKWAFT